MTALFSQETFERSKDGEEEGFALKVLVASRGEQAGRQR